MHLSKSPDFRKLDELPGEDFLNDHCRPVIRKAECLRAELKKCSESRPYVADEVARLNSGLDFVRTVCDEHSELRKRYMENVGCYNRVFPQMLDCANTTHELIHDFVESLSDSEDIIYSHCLSESMLFGCVVQEAATVCGEEETDPLRDVLNQIHSTFTKPDCPDEDKNAEWEARLILFVSEQALNIQE